MRDTHGNELTYQNRIKGLKLSTLGSAVGIFYFVAISAGFMTGFLRKLGASQFQIGLVNGLAPIVAIIQLLASYLIEHKGWQRKPLLIISATIQRTLLVVILLTPYLFGYKDGQLPSHGTVQLAVWLVFVVFAISQLCGSLGGLAWQIWIGDLLPSNQRGAYYGTRQAIVNAVWVVSSILIGKFLDLHNTFTGFAIVFGFAAFFGLLDNYIHARVPEPEIVREPVQGKFLERIKIPIKDKYFSGLIHFVLLWNFAVWVAQPFISVYQLETLEMSYLGISYLDNLYMIWMMIGAFLAGKIGDRVSAKKIYAASLTCMICLPLFWIFSTKDTWLPILTVMQIISGITNGFAAVALNKLLLELSPQAMRSVYIAVYGSITGLAGGLGPIVGGVIGNLVATVSFTVGSLQLSGLRIIFLLSCILRLFTLPRLYAIKESREEEEEEIALNPAEFQCPQVAEESNATLS